jgi:hypothetical protein
VGDRDWYVFVCHVEVGDGKGAAMVIVGCMYDWGRMGDCSMRSSFLGEECPSLYLFEFPTPIQQQRCSICEARCGRRVAKDCVGSTAQRNPMVPEKRVLDPWN